MKTSIENQPDFYTIGSMFEALYLIFTGLTMKAHQRLSKDIPVKPITLTLRKKERSEKKYISRP